MIMAVDRSWGIGKDGHLLCHLPGDLRFFKQMTMGKTVVMGRVTLESLPGAKGLPGRRNIVLTRRKALLGEGLIPVRSVEALMDLLSGLPGEDVFVIGGSEIYRLLLPYCDRCYVTKIDADLDADRHFVNLDADPSFTAEPLGEAKEESGFSYRFYLYRRKKNGSPHHRQKAGNGSR